VTVNIIHELRFKNNGVVQDQKRAFISAFTAQYKTLGSSFMIDLVANDSLSVFINQGHVFSGDSGDF
jgi:hypothetical protein